MKILVIGSGGREHALVRKIAASPKVKEIYAAPGNAGITQLAECVAIAPDNITELAAFAKMQNIDLTVVGPELPLTLGIVDEFQKQGLACFGPSQRASIVEASKVFTKEFCTRHKIPTAPFCVFTDAEHAKTYVRETGIYPVVIKADGLAAGKGVIVAKNEAEATIAIDDMLRFAKFGEAGAKIVIEDFLPGREVSLFLLTDGEAFIELPSAQDHKRIFDNDEGPNTGGMGAYAPVPWLTAPLHQKILDQIALPTLVGLKEENRRFVGFLYLGLMIGADDQPRLIEYNCRLGDPEAQTVLPLLDTDLVELMQLALKQGLKNKTAQIKKQSSVTVVMASGGYPEGYPKGFPITGLDQLLPENVWIDHAGTVFENGTYKTSGGRVLSVTAIEASLSAAIDKAYRVVKKISWSGAQYRTDIAQKGL